MDTDSFGFVIEWQKITVWRCSTSHKFLCYASSPEYNQSWVLVPLFLHPSVLASIYVLRSVGRAMKKKGLTMT